jgi:toluene monooxygenase system protein D
MMNENGPDAPTLVGPVLTACEDAAAVVRAIRSLNPEVEVRDRGSYLRVQAPRRCIVTRAAIERALGRTFQLPGDLEVLMPAFKGRFRVSEEEASWSFEETS